MPSLGDSKGWCEVIVIRLHRVSNSSDEDEKVGYN